MEKNSFKYAFTLVELMVFFVFISLLLAASTPIITKRAKNIPIKIHHGKYICYGNHFEYYNSTRLVSEGAGCNFTPPKRAALFKIELIGAGAGGCEYTDWDEYDETKTGGYRLSSGAYGDGYTDINDGELYEMLYRAPFIYAVQGTKGGAGSATEGRTYVGVGSPHAVLNGACAGTCWSPRPYSCEVPCKKKGKNDKGEEIEVDSTCISTCYTTQAGDNMLEYPTCASCRSYMSDLRSIANSLANQKNCESSDWCYNIATTSFVQPYRDSADGVGRPNSWGTLEDFASWREQSGKGARGGYGKDFYVEGTIDFCDYSKAEGGPCAKGSDLYKKVMGGWLSNGKHTSGIGVKPYLRNLFGTYMVKGTSLVKGSCSSFGSTKYKEHPETKVGNSSSTYQHGQDGNDVLHYDALKLWGDRCYTNVERAKGGEGGWLQDTGDIIYGTNGTNLGGTLRKAFDASDYGITGTKYGPWTPQEGSLKDRIPWLTTATTLNVRWHEVGNGGGAGSYEIAYVPSLDNDCSFHVGRGGAPVMKGLSQSQLDALHESLQTSLSCNNGTLYLSAEGGIYNNKSSVIEYSGFDYITSSGTFTNPSSFVSRIDGAASPFRSQDVFTKYVLKNVGSIGAGGDGSTITDACTQPHGEWHVDRVYYDGIDKSDDQTWPAVPCSDVKTTPATNGSDGVIIISW